MKWLARGLGGLLAIALAVSAVAIVVNGTTWSTPAMTKAASDSDFYAATAKALPEVLVGNGGTDAAELRLALADVLTTSLVKDKLEPLIGELETYYRNAGAVPMLDLRDVQLRLGTTGLALPPTVGQRLETPIPLSTTNLDSVLGGSSRTTAKLAWMAPLAAAILAGLIVLVTRRRRWLVLAGGTAGAAVLALIAAGAVVAGPHLIASTIDTSELRPLTPAIRHLTEVVASRQTHQLLIAAAVFGVAAALLGVVHGVTRMLGRFGHHAREH